MRETFFCVGALCDSAREKFRWLPVPFPLLLGAERDKPRLIHVSIQPADKVRFTVQGSPRQAIDDVFHAALGGFTGIISPLVGKQPPTFTSGFSAAPHPPSFGKKDSFTKAAPSGAGSKSVPHSPSMRETVSRLDPHSPEKSCEGKQQKALARVTACLSACETG